MLLKMDTLRSIRAGEVDLAFRYWRTSRVTEGTRLRTPVGLVEVVSVTKVAKSRITADEARRAGLATRTELLDGLRSGQQGSVYRIELRYGGDDPRIALRSRASVTRAEVEVLSQRFERMDRRSSEPWTRQTLELIRDRPAVRAADLAATTASDTRPFKARVRRLKELGLTESLEVGYRLSPRGAAVLLGLAEQGQR